MFFFVSVVASSAREKQPERQSMIVALTAEQRQFVGKVQRVIPNKTPNWKVLFLKKIGHSWIIHVIPANVSVCFQSPYLILHENGKISRTSP